jgi:AcrR family transcriptional regulator
MNKLKSRSLKQQTPAVRDAEATKNSILDAAEKEFAVGGLLGARTEAIAAKTGVTKCMIFYYFGNKEGLYKAVLERGLSDFVRSLQGIDIHSVSPQNALRNLTEAILNTVETHANLHRILIYENIQNEGKFYGQIAFASVYGPIVEVLKRGIAAGEFRKLDPIHVAVNIVGLCVQYFGFSHNVKHLWPPGTNPSSKEMVEAHKREAVEQVVASVLATDSD